MDAEDVYTQNQKEHGEDDENEVDSATIAESIGENNGADPEKVRIRAILNKYRVRDGDYSDRPIPLHMDNLVSLDSKWGQRPVSRSQRKVISINQRHNPHCDLPNLAVVNLDKTKEELMPTERGLS